MRKRSIGAICRYVLEAVAPIARNICTKGCQLLGSIPFRNLPSGINLIFKPIQEGFHRNSIIDIGLPLGRNLRLRLDGLFKNNRRSPGNYVCKQSFQKRSHVIVQARRICKNHRIRIFIRKYLQSLHEGLIFADGNPIQFKFRKTVNRIRVIVPIDGLGYKPFDIILSDKKIGYHKRIVLNVIAPDIKHPCNFIKRGKKQRRSTLDHHPFSQPCYLLHTLCPPETVHVHGGDRAHRKQRTVLPQHIQHIRHINHKPSLSEGREDLGNEPGTHAKAIHSNNPCPAGKPLGYKH